MAQTVCPSCGRSLEPGPAGDALATCPGCRSTVVVPGSDELPLLVSSGEAGPRRAGRLSIPPEILRQYQLERLLGSGSAGMVFTATQVAVGRRVAVKFLLALDERTMARFHAEARLLAMVSHPNVLKVFDSGSAGGHPYLVAELLEGGTLRERLQRSGRIACEETLTIAEAVLAGLEECHRRGIVHRDLKPENILFSADGVPKIVDLGLAKFFGQESTVTQAGMITGTPRYMAPEQIRGETVSAATDVYAMALVIHEMLSGRPVCGGSNVMAILRMHLEDPPAPIRELAEVPEGVARAIDRALSKDPAARPASAAGFSRRLRDGQAGHDVEPLPGPVPEGRGRVRVALALMILGACLCGSLALRTGALRPPAAPSIATLAPSSDPKEVELDLLATVNAEEEWNVENSSVDRRISGDARPDFAAAVASTGQQLEDWTTRWESLRRREAGLSAGCPDPERCPGPTAYLLARVRVHVLVLWGHLRILENRLDRIRYASSGRSGLATGKLAYAAYQPQPQGWASLSGLIDLRATLKAGLGWADRGRGAMELVQLLDDLRRLGGQLRQLGWSKTAQDAILAFEHDLGSGLTPPLGTVASLMFAWGFAGAPAVERQRSMQQLRQGLVALGSRYPVEGRWPFEQLVGNVDREPGARPRR